VKQSDKLIAIFCDVDDFCKVFEKELVNYSLPEECSEKLPKCAMSLSEIMTICIFFHLSNMRTFKWYYKQMICENFKSYFPKILSYNRFVEVMKLCLVPLLFYLTKTKFGKCTGINFVDSTPIKVCNNRRIHSNKVFKDLASRGKSSTGWFFGFKLHLIINENGEILSFSLTGGNTSDNNIKNMKRLTKNIFGKLFGDKGYISQKLSEILCENNINLLTKVKKNMKNRLMNIYDKILLRKRAIIESVNDFLKNICQIEHSRHRSATNFVLNLISGLVAYCFIPKKPSLNFSTAGLIGA